jgi:hypothetical protein
MYDAKKIVMAESPILTSLKQSNKQNPKIANKEPIFDSFFNCFIFFPSSRVAKYYFIEIESNVLTNYIFGRSPNSASNFILLYDLLITAKSMGV